MGYYVNPPSGDKRAWLEANGVRTAGPSPITESHLPVCLVNNGPFDAAGVGYSPQEVEAFNQPSDRRPKQWYTVPRTALQAVGAI